MAGWEAEMQGAPDHFFAEQRPCMCFTTEREWRPCPQALCERPDHAHSRDVNAGEKACQPAPGDTAAPGASVRVSRCTCGRPIDDPCWECE